MKRKLLSFLICFVLILPCAFIFTACGEVKPKSMSVSNAKVDFFYQDEFSFGESAEVEIKTNKKKKSFKFDTDGLTYDAEEKIAETNDYKVDYSNYNSSEFGEYEINVIYKHNTDITYSYKVTVSPKKFADEDVIAEDYVGVYDGQAHSIDISCEIDNAEISYSADGSTYSKTLPMFIDAGEYKVYYKVEKDFYETLSGTKKVLIGKKEVVLNWGNTSFVYDKTEKVPECTISDLVADDVCTVTVTGEQINVGNYTATATTISNKNYKLPQEKTKSFVIAPKKITKPEILGGLELVYNALEQELQFADQLEEGIITTGTGAAINMGRYAYTLKLISDNYVWSDNTKQDIVINWQIKKKEVDVPKLEGEYTYNTLPQTVNIIGFDESIMIKTGTEKSTNAGSFAVRFNLKDTLNYYWSGDNISVLSGEKIKYWSIDKATIKADDMEWDYLGPIPYDGTVKTVELKNIPSGYEPIYEENIKTNAGTYQATVMFLYDALNYNPLEVIPLTWTILKINPTYTLPTGVSVEKTNGLKLSDISLEDFEGFEWLSVNTSVNESGYYTAKYTPEDTVNYNVLQNIKIYVTVIDSLKQNFTSYVYDNSNIDTSKDLAIFVNSGEWTPDAEFTVEVKVGTDFATGNASGATITYNGKSNFVVTMPGEYLVEIRVVKEGYNDFYTNQKLVVTKATPSVQNIPEVVSDEIITVDDTLERLSLENGVVVYDDVQITGNWFWKEPITPLTLGEVSYKAIFMPIETDYYQAIEVDILISATEGLPIRTFKIGNTVYTVPKNQDYAEFKIPLSYGESIVVDFSDIKESNNIYIGGDLQEVKVFDLIYDNELENELIFEFGTESDNIKQTIKIEYVEEYYLEEFRINYKNENNDISEVDLLMIDSANIKGEVVYIGAEPIDGYTVFVYVNDALIGANISNVELVLGLNKVLAVVKDDKGNTIRFIQKEFNYMIPESYGLEETASLASVLGNGSSEMIVVNSNDTSKIILTTNINYNINAYKMNNGSSAYSLVEFDSPISISAGNNVFKVVLTIPNSASVVKEIVIYDASASYGAAYDKNSVEYKVELANDEKLSNIDVLNIYEPIDILNELNIYCSSDNTKKAEISHLINDYYLVKVVENGDNLFKIIKINKWFVEED